MHDFREMKERFSIEELEQTVLNCLGTNKVKLFAKDRKRELVYSRGVLYHFLRKHTNLSLTMIGDRYDRHHSTVMYALSQLATYKNYDEKINSKIKMLEERLANKPKIIICGQCGREI